MWDKSKAKEKADISRIAVEARDKAEAEAKARVRGKYNAVHRAAAKTADNIRAII